MSVIIRRMDFFTFINTYQYSFVPALIAFIIISVIAIYLGIIFWVARDITTRSKNILAIVGAIILVILLNIIGLAFYLLVRPNKTLSENINYLGFSVVENPNLINCISCHEVIRHEYNNCPYCGVQQNLICPDCGIRHNPTWQFCQECGHNFAPQNKNIFTKLFSKLKYILAWPFVSIAKIFKLIAKQIIRVFKFITSLMQRFNFRFIKLPKLPSFKFNFRKRSANLALAGAESANSEINLESNKSKSVKKQGKQAKNVTSTEENTNNSLSDSAKPIKFNKDGTPRKARADAGKIRGKYKPRQSE